MDIKLGLALVSFIFGIGISWGILSSKVNAQEEIIKPLPNQVVYIKAQVEHLNRSLDEIKIELRGLRSDLRNSRSTSGGR